MTTITNPALFSYKLGVSKYGLFKKVPFMIAYWEKDNGFQHDFINLIQLSANRMDFAHILRNGHEVWHRTERIA